LLFDREAMIRAADDAGIAIEAFATERIVGGDEPQKSGAKRKS
jgi:hypothetical protein